MNFQSYVQSFHKLYLDAKGQAESELPALGTLIRFQPKKILIIAPHPDDECLMAGLPLRAKLELNAEVAVVPFTYGSKLDRMLDRKHELDNALQILEFAKVDPRTSGEAELDFEQLRSVIELFHPDTVVLPHQKDGHATHIRCSHLALQAILEVAQKQKRRIQVLQTEFWHSMESPNLLVPLSAEMVTRMGKALLCHVGEVSRNPYHLTLPAWLMDQVRRGSEIEKGAVKGSAVFGQLYRHEEIG